MKKIFFLLLIIGCANKDSCIQKARTSSTVHNLTGHAVTVEFSYYNHSLERESQNFNLGTNKQKITLYNFEYKKDPHYQGKIDFFPEDASCSEEPTAFSGSVSLTTASFAVYNLCFPLYTDYPGYLVDKASACPAGTIAQATPVDP